jgi:K+-sensing histidine kinase KdpD
MLSRDWIISPGVLAGSAFVILFALTIWWIRERELSLQRGRLRTMTALAEDVISANTPAEIARKVSAVLPRVTKAYKVSLYLLNRNGSALDRVPTDENPEPLSVSLQSPIGSLSAVVALCFRNRAQLHIPNTARSPLFQDAGAEELPRSALLIPMFAQKNLVGILALNYRSRMNRVSPDEQSGMQHLANQIATSLRLQEQHSMRDQLLRSEKMAAAGQLISGVANELRVPLNAIHRLATALLASPPGRSVHEDELREIAFEADRGSEIVSRLVSFANTDQHEFKPLNLIGVITSLMEFREREWELKGLHVRNQLPQAVCTVIGNQSQLEQVMLNLLVHAEQSLAGLENQNINIGAKTIGRKLLVTIEYSEVAAPSADQDVFADSASADALGMQVCEAIVHSHGGQLRVIRNTPSGSRFELELPLKELSHARSAEVNGSPGRAARPLTVLLVEPDPVAQRRLLSFLTARGHRGVPVTSAEEAIDMVHRLRFEVVFCAVRLPGLNWVELFEKIRRQVGAFVLVTEGFDADLSRAFKGSDGYLLSKPVDEAEVHKLLTSIESRQESVSKK